MYRVEEVLESVPEYELMCAEAQKADLPDDAIAILRANFPDYQFALAYSCGGNGYIVTVAWEKDGGYDRTPVWTQPGQWANLV